MTLVYGLEGQEGCKVAANILYGFDCSRLRNGFGKAKKIVLYLTE